MATAALVDRDIEIGRRILVALSKAGVAVSVAFWAYVPQVNEWQLFIATPLVDAKGNRAAYDQVLRALQNAGINGDLPWRRIFLRSPKDNVLKSLEKRSKAAPDEVFRVVNNEIGGRFVEDAYLYVGTIFIVKAGSSRPNQREFYSAIYSPQSSMRAPARPLRFETIEEIRGFLENDLHLDTHRVDLEIEKLKAGQSVRIPVSLSAAQLSRLGLG